MKANMKEREYPIVYTLDGDFGIAAGLRRTPAHFSEEEQQQLTKAGFSGDGQVYMRQSQLTLAKLKYALYAERAGYVGRRMTVKEFLDQTADLEMRAEVSGQVMRNRLQRQHEKELQQASNTNHLSCLSEDGIFHRAALKTGRKVISVARGQIFRVENIGMSHDWQVGECYFYIVENGKHNLKLKIIGDSTFEMSLLSEDLTKFSVDKVDFEISEVAFDHLIPQVLEELEDGNPRMLPFSLYDRLSRAQLEVQYAADYGRLLSVGHNANDKEIILRSNARSSKQETDDFASCTLVPEYTDPSGRQTTGFFTCLSFRGREYIYDDARVDFGPALCEYISETGAITYSLHQDFMIPWLSRSVPNSSCRELTGVVGNYKVRHFDRKESILLE